MPKRHVTREALEDYTLERVSVPTAARIEEHLLVCQRCRDGLVRAGEFIEVLKRALALSKGLIELHGTPDGLVSLRVYEAPHGWLARVVGREVDSGAVLTTRDRAVARCRSLFAQLFPDHACTSVCRTITADGSPPMHARCAARVPILRTRP